MSSLASWVSRHRRRLGLSTHVLGQRSGVSHQIPTIWNSAAAAGSAHNLLQLATFFHQQDPSIDVSLPTLLALTQNTPRGRRARTQRQPSDGAA